MAQTRALIEEATYAHAYGLVDLNKIDMDRIDFSLSMIIKNDWYCSNEASENGRPRLRPNQREWKYRDGHQRG